MTGFTEDMSVVHGLAAEEREWLTEPHSRPRQRREEIAQREADKRVTEAIESGLTRGLEPDDLAICSAAVFEAWRTRPRRVGRSGRFG